jgi:hypothetical protein
MILKNILNNVFELIPEFFGLGLGGEDHHCPLEAGYLNTNIVLQKLRSVRNKRRTSEKTVWRLLAMFRIRINN